MTWSTPLFKLLGWLLQDWGWTWLFGTTPCPFLSSTGYSTHPWPPSLAPRNVEPTSHSNEYFLGLPFLHPWGMIPCSQVGRSMSGNEFSWRGWIIWFDFLMTFVVCSSIEGTVFWTVGWKAAPSYAHYMLDVWFVRGRMEDARLCIFNAHVLDEGTFLRCAR